MTRRAHENLITLQEGKEKTQKQPEEEFKVRNIVGITDDQNPDNRYLKICYNLRNNPAPKKENKTRTHSHTPIIPVI